MTNQIMYGKTSMDTNINQLRKESLIKDLSIEKIHLRLEYFFSMTKKNFNKRESFGGNACIKETNITDALSVLTKYKNGNMCQCGR